MRCRVCGTEFTGNYCPNCGIAVRPQETLGYGPAENIKILGSVIWLLSIFSYIAILLICVALLFVSLGIVPTGILGSGYFLVLYFITPYPIGFTELTGYLLLGWFAFIFVAVLASFIWLLYSSTKDTWDSIRLPITKLRERLGSTSTISMLTQLFMAVLFFNTMYYLVLALFNVEINVPVGGSGDTGLFLLQLVNASVYEEIVTRILFIGIPLFLVNFAKGERGESRKARSYILGGGFDMNLTTTILLLFSSGMFAFAHLASWDITKIPPTFVGGLALGYLFLRKGLFASIMLHFSVNYFAALGSLVEDNFVASAILGLFILLIALFGALFFINYMMRISGHFSKEPEVPESQAPVAQEAPSPYQCPRCGNMEARYIDGTFECLSCGHRV
jgi:hypothetical protein